MAEYIPNAWPSLGSTYYVAQGHPEASDENPGTQASPFKTISAAAKVADMYDKVVIDEGVYREQISVFRHGHRFYPQSLIVFEAAPGEEVYVKGSDVFDAEWKDIGGGVHAADLPGALFDEGAYNPYELACHPRPNPHTYTLGACNPAGIDDKTDDQSKVRPTQASQLPETLGQIYVDGEALDQLDSLEAVRKAPNSFVVSADGRQIICHFHNGQIPESRLVELSMRERCFKPVFPMPPGGLLIKTLGILAEHAADPGAFSLCRPLSIRRNRRPGITIRKTFHALNRLAQGGVFRSNVSYLSKDKPAILCRVREGAKPLPPDKLGTITLLSDDGAKTWKRIESGPLTERMARYFLDEDNGMLLRYYRKSWPGNDGGDAEPVYSQQVSADGGATWSSPEPLDFNEEILCYRIMRLRDGKLLWMTTERKPELSSLAGILPHPLYFVARAWLGSWRSDLSGIDWTPAGELQVGPEKSVQGLDEPSACELPDGKIFAVFRQSCILPTQERPGFPCVKLLAVSADQGRTWTEPEPLSFDDGKYAYTSTSYAETFRSSRNGRVYVMFNILNRSFQGCLPRIVLHIAEVDPNTFRIKRDTVAVVEEIHEEHTHFVGYSNWAMLEDRYTKNVNLFTKLENGPVYDGYDHNSYRYEIELPE